MTGMRTLCGVKWNFLIAHNRTSIFDQTKQPSANHSISPPLRSLSAPTMVTGEAWTSWKAPYQWWLLSFSSDYQQPKITLFNFPSRGRSPGPAISYRDLFSQSPWPTSREQEGQTHLHLGALPSAPWPFPLSRTDFKHHPSAALLPTYPSSTWYHSFLFQLIIWSCPKQPEVSQQLPLTH